MIKNYFKIAFRNLGRNKVYSLINITGLSIGLASCLIVANVVIDDLSYDKQWKNVNHIFRVITTDNGTQETIPVTLSGLGPALQKDFPEVKGYCRITEDLKIFSIDSGKKMYNVNCLTSEPSFLNIFDFNFLEGSPQTFTYGYTNVIITQKIKEEYFQHTNPVGKTIQAKLLDGSMDTAQYLITGVIKNIPYNSHLRADVILLKQFSESDNAISPFGVGRVYPLYLLIKSETNLTNFSTKVNNMYKKMVVNNRSITIKFQPLADIYLYSEFAKRYQPVIGSFRNVYIFSGVAIILLMIACLNFINLTTARTLKRLAETGVRKILGADKLHLIIQFLFESFIFFIISFFIAIIFYWLLLKPVETYLGHTLTISLISNLKLWAGIIAIVLLVCIFTGLYPAMVLSRGNPSLILKGKISKKTGSSFLRKSLVVIQFTISIIILIATIVIRNQVYFLNHKDIGYDKNNLMQIGFTDWGDKGEAFKQQIKNLPGVQNASITKWVAGKGGSFEIEMKDPSQKDKSINLSFIEGDIDFIPTLKLQLLKGRLLNSQFASDALDPNSLYDKKEFKKLAEAEAYQSELLTSYTAKLLGIKNLNKPSLGMPGVPVGIVKDFHNESLLTAMNPCIIQANNNIRYGSMLIRINPGAEEQVINSMQRIWNKFYPDQILAYNWVSDALQKQFVDEQKMQQLFFFFSFLAVFLACLGLFGLVIFTTELRTKEIGIRKVIGASISSVVTTLSKDFLKLVMIAIVIAIPVAWVVTSKWLENYPYRILLSWWIFALAAISVILIALLTVSFQSIKAAVANPVESLRKE